MKIENRQKLLMIMAAAAVGLLIADNLLIEPAIKWWSARSKEITELRADVKRGKSQIAREQVIRGEWDHMRSNTLPTYLISLNTGIAINNRIESSLLRSLQLRLTTSIPGRSSRRSEATGGHRPGSHHINRP